MAGNNNGVNADIKMHFYGQTGFRFSAVSNVVCKSP